MNQQDRVRLTRLYSVLSAVPFPASGDQTTTRSGLGGYTMDMREMTPAVTKVMIGMCCASLANPEIVVEEDYKDPDRLLTAIEQWIAVRGKAGWQGVPPEIMTFYERLRSEQTDRE
jgi:hypothetical protein